MNQNNIINEGFFDKLKRLLGLSSKQEKILKKSKKFNTALKDLNMTVSELEDELNVRFKELDPKHKKVTLTKYKVGDFTKQRFIDGKRKFSRTNK